MKTLRNGTKAVVAVTAESPPPVLLLSKPGASGRYAFPAAIGYAAGTCGDAYVEAFKRKVSDKGVGGFASEDEYQAWVRQQNLALKNDVLQLLETTIDRLTTAGVCAAGAELTISQIFVIQAVQDPDHPVPLVAGKTGVVRVIPLLKGTETPLDGVKVSLRAVSQTGQAFALDPLSPTSNVAKVNGEGGFQDFDNLSESATFLLPADKAAEGSLTLEAEAVAPSGASLSNPSAKQAATVTFRRGPTLSVGYVTVCYLSATQCPSQGISTAHDFMNRIFPVADGAIRYDRLPAKFPEDPWKEDLKTDRGRARFEMKLKEFYNSILGTKPDQVVVWLPDISDFNSAGSSDPIYLGGEGRVVWVQDTSQAKTSAALDWQHTLAHEIGHNLGLRHTGTTDRQGARECTSPAKARLDNTKPLERDETDWIYQSGQINGRGFDPRAKKVVPGQTKYDVMTYCEPDIWISPFHYTKLFDGALQPRGRAPGGRTAALAAPESALRWAWRSWQPVPAYGAEPSEFLIVSGIASSDGQRVRLEPVYRVPDTGTGTPHDPSGNYCVRLTGGIRAEQVCFALTFMDHRMRAVPEQGFSIKVPFPPGTSRLSLLREGRELAAVTSGLTAPRVSIQGVSSGQTLRGASTITWAGGNSDRNGVTYVVLYTPNGGGTWYPLAIDATESRLSFDTADLASSERAMFRVLSSRGLSTTVAEAGPVKVIGWAPGAVHVALPSTAAARYVTLTQSLLWAGTAVWLIFRRRRTPPVA